VFINRCGGAEYMVISWMEGAVTEDDVTRLVAMVREGLTCRADDAEGARLPGDDAGGARLPGAPVMGAR
jgi:hypothetical protein